MLRHVAIVGAGFTGVLHAINLLRHEGPRATLIERHAAPGAGLAYGSAHPAHLLNVRAANMSAFPDDPGHFIAWLRRRGEPASETAFVPRLLYGTYLRELLDQAVAASAGRLAIVQGEAVDIDLDNRARVRLSDGRVIVSDAVVLALGNLPPHTPPGLDPKALGACYKPDPWAPDATACLDQDARVLVIGTGLTMVDTVLKLEAEGFGGSMVAISRHGLLPRAHGDARRADPPRNARPAPLGSGLIREVRERSAAIGWRSAVDELRPDTQTLWRAASAEQKGRFLRHLRAWWDVHRHRIAPGVADRLAALQATGRLTVLAGKGLGYARDGSRVAIRWRPRGEDTEAVLPADRIINCTGPQGDLSRSDSALLAALARRGVLRPDAFRLGIDVTADGDTVNAAGRTGGLLFALGPMTRGAFWESVAVPDIREQAWTLARRLSNAQWIEGEGL